MPAKKKKPEADDPNATTEVEAVEMTGDKDGYSVNPDTGVITFDRADHNNFTAQTNIGIVPEQFSRMPDAVLSVAMRVYQQHMHAGRKEEHAIADAITAAKEYAKARGIPYRK